jgi:hypothetical protein
MNRLASESSLYLRQHQHNPVDWYPWGEEAWERARREDKPVLVSIGYSSCHWCHVMERESFEDPEVARLMNAQLVAIKVDREERPDVDQVYMEAVLRLAGQGGWPLNMFCKPDGRPFHGGTYFPPRRMYGRPSWADVVLAVARAYREQPGEVEELSRRLVASIGERPDLPRAALPGRSALAVLCRKLEQSADRTHGGFGGAPKFPTPTNLEAIVCGRHLSVSDGGAFEQLCFTLGQMARGGIYDQLGGGFHRYSTDARWLVPHFEKMLYDNGQLLRVYANVYRLTGEPELRWPVAETAAWLEREMLGPRGEAYASQDADSEGEEGRYFVWSPDEIEALLGVSSAREFCAAYGVSAQGNFEHTGKSVLSQARGVEREAFAEPRARLLRARGERVAPATDPKCIAAWQGYALGGLAAAGSAFGEPRWLGLARRMAAFALERLSDEGSGLLRIWDGERARIPGFLDDHAALLCALCDLFRADPDPRWIAAALRLAETIAHEFYDAGRRDLHFTRAADRTLVVRPATDSDGATPGAAGLALLGLVRVAALSGRADLHGVARAVLESQAAIAERVPLHLPTLVRAGALDEFGIGVGIVIGEPADPRTRALLERARALLGPDDFALALAPGERPAWLDPAWLEGRSAQGGRPTAFLCRGTTCSLPAHEPEALALPPVA